MEQIAKIIERKLEGNETEGYRTNLVIFLSERKFMTKKTAEKESVELISYSYYDTQKKEAGELVMRVDNIVNYGADKIILKNDLNFIEYAIAKKEKEWSGGVNLILEGVSITGRKYELRQIAVL